MRALAAVLPDDGDAERRLHEAAVLLDALSLKELPDNAALYAVFLRLRRFDLCRASQLAPYVRARLASPFAGDADRRGTLSDRVELLKETLRAYDDRQGLTPAPKHRVRLLVAAFLLLLETPALGQAAA